MSLSAYAQQCPFPEPRTIKTDEHQWKDGGTSMISRLTFDGKPVEILFRFDEKGHLMCASISRLTAYSDGRFPSEQIDLAVKYGGGSSPYSVFTEIDEQSNTWTKKYFDWNGQLVMLEKIPIAETENGSTHFFPNGNQMEKTDIDKAWEQLNHAKTKWLRTLKQE